MVFPDTILYKQVFDCRIQIGFLYRCTDSPCAADKECAIYVEEYRADRGAKGSPRFHFGRQWFKGFDVFFLLLEGDRGLLFFRAGIAGDQAGPIIKHLLHLYIVYHTALW